MNVAFDKAALVGEPAVPCNLQSATAAVSSVDDPVSRNGNP